MVRISVGLTLGVPTRSIQESGLFRAAQEVGASCFDFPFVKFVYFVVSNRSFLTTKHTNYTKGQTGTGGGRLREPEAAQLPRRPACAARTIATPRGLT